MADICKTCKDFFIENSVYFENLEQNPNKYRKWGVCVKPGNLQNNHFLWYAKFSSLFLEIEAVFGIML